MLLIFEIPVGKVHSIRNFAVYVKNNYKAQTAYIAKDNLLHVNVDPVYRNNVINAALSYDFVLISG